MTALWFALLGVIVLAICALLRRRAELPAGTPRQIARAQRRNRADLRRALRGRRTFPAPTATPPTVKSDAVGLPRERSARGLDSNRRR